MNISELSAKVNETVKASSSTIKSVLQTAFDEIGNALQAGDQVRLQGFGTFKSHNQKAREGRNPATGEAIDIPAKIVAKFKPANDLAEKVNNPPRRKRR